ncbi:MAG: hypothetical protein AAGM67_07290, partial [Bacteroidota bacterium]
MDELVYPNHKPEELRRFWGGFGFKKLIFTNTSHYKIFTGHFPYGIHHFIRQRCEYFTFLREPIARAISHYNFVKYTGPGAQPNEKNDLHQRYTLEEIFNQPIGRHPFRGILTDNMQTRFLAGYYYYFLPKDSSILLKAAKKNLRTHYKAFGLQERYADSVQLIADTFDWKREELGVRHKKSPKKDPVTDETLRILRENHLLDLELYDYAKELFDR